ncbi:hypothetical protein STEG23_014076, partial [Scotinomys teguina]
MKRRCRVTGRDYEKDKVCSELAMLGKDDFRSLSLILYSRKFSSGTFEQVSQLVKEVVALTEECCAEGADPKCYDTRRLQIKQSSLLTTLSNRLCSQYAAYGKEKSRLSHLIKLAQKVPTANLEDVMPLAEELTQVLSRCCESTSEDCMARELLEHTSNICDNLSIKNSKFEECCQEKAPMDIFMCTYFMPAAEPLQLPALKLPTKTDLCGQSTTQAMDQYTFELSRRTRVPEVFLSKVLETTLKSLSECCDTQDSTACFNTQ